MISIFYMYSVLTIQDCSDTTVLSHVRRVACIEDFFEILHMVHCQERGHVGYKNTLAEVFDVSCHRRC